MAQLCTLIWVCGLIRCSISGWIEKSTLETHEYGWAVGTYDDKIYLIGEHDVGPSALIEYSIWSDTFKDILPSPVRFFDIKHGNGQYWTQVEHTVYMIHPKLDISYILAYDLSTRSCYTYTQIPIYVFSDIVQNTNYACLASKQGYLYVVGGVNAGSEPIDTFQVFNMNSTQWIIAKVMNVARRGHACVVHNGYLYALGGFTPQRFSNSTERISIHNISYNNWQNSVELLYKTSCARAISHGNNIFIIGGMAITTAPMQIIDTNTSFPTISEGEPLPYELYAMGIIYKFPNIYIFGGKTGIYDISNAFFYYKLDPTMNPTQVTLNPSLATHEPTVSTVTPSVFPTSNPTFYPTTYPTNIPTMNPSIIPTVDPTTIPTLVPSNDPSSSPTTIPTIFPTRAATAVPTHVPTDDPTNNPTIYLIVKTTHESEVDESKGDSSDVSEIMTYVVIGIVLWMLACGCVTIWCRKTSRALKADRNEKNIDNDIDANNYEPGAA